jgi:hypothetical protein
VSINSVSHGPPIAADADLFSVVSIHLKTVASKERRYFSLRYLRMYRRRNRYWTADEDRRLRMMAIDGAASTRIAAALHRSQSSIAMRAKQLNVSIRKPTRLPTAERQSVIR